MFACERMTEMTDGVFKLNFIHKNSAIVLKNKGDVKVVGRVASMSVIISGRSKVYLRAIMKLGYVDIKYRLVE